MVSIRSTEAKCSGREGRDALESHAHAGFAYRVADGEDAGVEHADDVPGVGLVDDRALLRHELLRLRKAQRLAALHVVILLIALEAGRSRCA